MRLQFDRKPPAGHANGPVLVIVSMAKHWSPSAEQRKLNMLSVTIALSLRV
jgi:hypothetical protein